MHDLSALACAAFHNERVAARRLARNASLDQASALYAILQGAAAKAGASDLDALLRQRVQARQDELARRAAKAQARAEARATAELAKHGQRAHPAHGAWRAWFDGSATPNPGLLGIGALLESPQGERVEISRRAGHGSSSDAEYLALAALLEAAVQAGPAVLTVYGDSRVVIDDVNAARASDGAGNDAGVRGAKGMEAHRARVLSLMAQLPDVTLRWVPRHRNGAADGLSQQAIRAG